MSPYDCWNYQEAVFAYRRWYGTTDPVTAGRLRDEADWRFSRPLADVATAMAVLGHAVEHSWVYAEELDSVRAFFAETSARELAESILGDVVAVPFPAHERARSSWR